MKRTIFVLLALLIAIACPAVILAEEVTDTPSVDMQLTNQDLDALANLLYDRIMGITSESEQSENNDHSEVNIEDSATKPSGSHHRRSKKEDASSSLVLEKASDSEKEPVSFEDKTQAAADEQTESIEESTKEGIKESGRDKMPNEPSRKPPRHRGHHRNDREKEHRTSSSDQSSD